MAVAGLWRLRIFVDVCLEKNSRILLMSVSL